MNTPSPRDGDSDDPLDDDLGPAFDRTLDGAFATARTSDTVVPSDSVLEQLAARIGTRPAVTLRDVEPAGQTPMLKPLVAGEPRAAGRYVVHGLLGQGGVGAVHKGHDQDLGRDVALKFLHERYAHEPAVLQRFVEEAQIGGQLQHPGIVPVYELGVVDGRPFFAMKMVKGQTLAQRLADRASAASDRGTFLAIFEDVCQTMAYAHARGVVHRDLKPSNVMIGAFGEVQVVDWGMGKVLERGGIADEKRAAQKHSALSVVATLRSQGYGTQSVMGSVMGTPAYMPPEQARGDVEQMDARSDVFALGAMLCEILTGQPPYVGPGSELIAMAAMARLDDALARLRACGAEQDLIDLAIQCLMPAPAARPQSAERVALVIRNHLAAAEQRVQQANVEVAAARARAAGLKRAQKLGIALTTVIAAGLVVSLWFYREADAQRLRAEKFAKQEQAAAELAEAQRDKAERMADFMAETLQGAGPSVALGRDTTMLREMMDVAAKRIDAGELTAAPEAEWRMRWTLGNTYGEIAAFDAAQRMLEPALELARSLHPGDHETIALTLNALATVLHARGDVVAAAPLFREALEMTRRLHPGDHAEVATAINNVAWVFHAGGDVDAAEPLYREALAMRRRLVAGDDVDVASAINNLADLLLERGDAAAAEPYWREALAMLRRLFPGDRPDIATCLNNLGQVLRARGDAAAAEPLLREALEMRRRLFPGDSPDVAGSLNNLAMLLQARGDLAAAEPLLRDALAMLRRLIPDDHPHVAGCMLNLGSMLRARGDLAAAEPLLRDAVAMQRRIFAGDHPALAVGINNLAMVVQARGDRDTAESLYREALAMFRRTVPGDHSDVARCLENLADLLRTRGDGTAADAYADEAAAMRRRLGR